MSESLTLKTLTKLVNVFGQSNYPRKFFRTFNFLFERPRRITCRHVHVNAVVPVRCFQFECASDDWCVDEEFQSGMAIELADDCGSHSFEIRNISVRHVADVSPEDLQQTTLLGPNNRCRGRHQEGTFEVFEPRIVGGAESVYLEGDTQIFLAIRNQVASEGGCEIVLEPIEPLSGS